MHRWGVLRGCVQRPYKYERENTLELMSLVMAQVMHSDGPDVSRSC